VIIPAVFGNTTMIFASLLLLAADDNPGNPLASFMVPFLLMIGAMYLIVIRPGQKKEKMQREKLLSSLKKNDRVLTSGGIIGIVASANEKEEELMIKVDDNVRIRILKSAIIRNFTNEEAAKEQGDKVKAGAGKDDAVTTAKT
jgi:preprotein translocase subunit YajC